MPGYTQAKDDHLVRLRHIESQVRGLPHMIENDEYCIDVLARIATTTEAPRAVSLSLLDEHVEHCVVQAIAEGGAAADAKINEAGSAIARLIRS